MHFILKIKFGLKVFVLDPNFRRQMVASKLVTHAELIGKE